MRIDIQARGFSLTEAMLHAIEHRANDYRQAFPDLKPALSVRLFDLNGEPHGGVDKGCLVHARLGAGRRTVVASDVDSDLHVAIQSAFAKVERATRAAVERRQRLRRETLKTSGGMFVAR